MNSTFKNIKITSHDLTLEIGSSSDKPSIDHSEGKVIGAFIVISNESDLPAGLTNVGISKPNGTVLVEEFDIRAWKQRSGGDFMSSILPISFDDQRVNILIQSDAAPATAIKFQLVLIHSKPQGAENLNTNC